MPVRKVRAVALMVVGSVLSGCAAAPSFEPAPDPVPHPTQTIGSEGDAPVEFVVRYDDSELRLSPTTWAVGDDRGEGSGEAASVGSPEEVFVFVPIAGWPLTSAIQFTGESAFACDGIAFDAAVEDLGGGWYAVRPSGPAEDYTLELSASSGPGSGLFPTIGEMTGHVKWKTSEGEPLPESSAAISLVADNDGTLEAWDLSLELYNVFPPPTEVSATVTVTSASGRSEVFHPRPTGACVSQSMFLVVPFDETQGVLELGDAPFVYDVELVIDGKAYTGTAQYSTGSASVPLAFTPALP